MQKVKLHTRLQEAMERRGMRAIDLVERTGIPKGTLSYYISGKTKPKSDRLYIIAEALDVNEAWLLGYDVPMQRTGDQKKNDHLAKMVIRMRNDEDFYNTVVSIAALNESQYRGIKQILSAFEE